MAIISKIFHDFLYQPLFNILVLFYIFIPGHDFGIAIIVLTIIIKLVLYPLGLQAIKTQKAFSRVQPMLEEIKEKYKNDKTQETKEIMALYQREKINPFSPILGLLIQLPILIALYWVFWQGLKPSEMSLLYSFIPLNGPIDPTFLKIFNLSQPNWVFALIAALAQFWQAKTAVVKRPASKKGKSDISKVMEKQMQYFMPIFTLFILLSLPSAIGLYWITNTLFTIGQQYIVAKKENKTTA
jgi:YidC/Oxa1 family membrane protein insertase